MGMAVAHLGFMGIMTMNRNEMLKFFCMRIMVFTWLVVIGYCWKL